MMTELIYDIEEYKLSDGAYTQETKDDPDAKIKEICELLANSSFKVHEISFLTNVPCHKINNIKYGLIHKNISQNYDFKKRSKYSKEFTDYVDELLNKKSHREIVLDLVHNKNLTFKQAYTILHYRIKVLKKKI